MCQVFHDLLLSSFSTSAGAFLAIPVWHIHVLPVLQQLPTALSVILYVLMWLAAGSHEPRLDTGGRGYCRGCHAANDHYSPVRTQRDYSRHNPSAWIRAKHFFSTPITQIEVWNLCKGLTGVTAQCDACL